MGHSRSGAFSFNPQKIILSPPCAFITSFNGRCPNESEATSSSFCSPLSSLCNRRLSPTSDCSSTLPPTTPHRDDERDDQNDDSKMRNSWCHSQSLSTLHYRSVFPSLIRQARKPPNNDSYHYNSERTTEFTHDCLVLGIRTPPQRIHTHRSDTP